MKYTTMYSSTKKSSIRCLTTYTLLKWVKFSLNCSTQRRVHLSKRLWTKRQSQRLSQKNHLVHLPSQRTRLKKSASAQSTQLFSAWALSIHLINRGALLSAWLSCQTIRRSSASWPDHPVSSKSNNFCRSMMTASRLTVSDYCCTYSSELLMKLVIVRWKTIGTLLLRRRPKLRKLKSASLPKLNRVLVKNYFSSWDPSFSWSSSLSSSW